MSHGRVIAVALGVIAISVMHFSSPTTGSAAHAWHVIFRKLYYVPVIAGALWFGLRGALATGAACGVLYAMHMWISWPPDPIERSDQIGELVSLLIIAVACGILVLLQMRANSRAERIERHALQEKTHA